MSGIKRVIKYTEGHKLISEPKAMGTVDGLSGVADNLPGDTIDPVTTGDSDPSIPGMSGNLPEENPDPLKVRIHKMPSRKLLNRLLGSLWQMRPGRPATDDEKIYRDENRRRKEMERLLRSEAEEYINRIVNALNTDNLCYRYPKSQKDYFMSGVQSVRFKRVVLSPDAIYLQINTKRRPRGVFVTDLMKPEVLTDLSLSVGHKVIGEYDEIKGAWYIVERATGARGIPNHVKLQDMLSRFPQTADNMTVPLGISINARPIFRSIRSGPHWLLAGTTGGGKSNELNVMLVTLLARNKPSELRMVMIDLKGGLELSHYAGIPHLLIDDNVTKTGIITRPEDVPTALFWIVQEAERRMRIISSAGYSDLVDYNARRSAKNKIPYLLVICDELASVKLLDPKAGRASERLWADLGNRGRAVGISLIICTQYPDKAVLSPSIKAVLNAKLAFACSTYPSSLVILGNGDAKGLSPVGRFVYQSGSEHITIQAPYFPKMFRDELIAKIKYGTADLNIGRSHDVTELEVMEWALQNNNGILSFRRLFEIFKGRGLTQVELNKWLSSWENQQYRLLDAWYQVNPGAGQKPRMLKAIDNTNAPADEENQNTKHKTQSDADIQPYQPHDTDVKKSKYKRKKRMDELLDDIDQTEDDEEGL